MRLTAIIALALVPAFASSAVGQSVSSKHQGPGSLPIVEPAELGFDAEKLKAIDDIVARGLADKKMPGCVIAFGRQNKLAWLKAYGNKRGEWEGEPAEAMTVDTVFDLASLTKPIATATCVMKLFEDEPTKLTKPVVNYLPAFAETGDEATDKRKRELLVADLLVHRTGLIADNPLADYEMGPEEARRRVLALKLPHEQWFRYSDVNFLVLGFLVEELSGKNVHEYSQEHIFQPLGMKDTTFNPDEELQKRCAPTERRNGRWMQGDVHDPRAFKLNGIAGHAGLFSTAGDLSKYAAAMLNRGRYQDVRVLNEGAWAIMTLPHYSKAKQTSDGRLYESYRGLGWDMDSPFSINGGKGRSKKAFGHGGFTGTVIWIDPEQDWFFIFLSNRVHPDGKGNVNPLAGEIATVISQATQKEK